MIHFSFSIQNPFKYEPFNSIKCWNGRVTKNKAWEIQLSKYAYTLLGISLDLAWKGIDHAGPKIEISLVGYTLDVCVYDIRHWSYDEHRWMEESDYPKEDDVVEILEEPK